jgi:hypothetical protein
MSFSWTRVGAILLKELRDYRRNRFVIGTMAMVPVLFIILPMIQLFAANATGKDLGVHVGLSLLYMLVIGSTDVRAAQQLSVLGGVPPLVILALMSLNVITVSTALALGLAAALLAVDLLAWRVVATMFDRERLVTGRPR